MPLIKFKFIQKGLIFFHQVVYPSCLPPIRGVFRRVGVCKCTSKFPIPVTMFVKHSQVPALLNTPWFFQYIPSLDGSLSLIWVSACFRSSFLKFSMPFICCSIFFSIWIAAITRAFTLQDLVFLYSWILIFWLDV